MTMARRPLRSNEFPKYVAACKLPHIPSACTGLPSTCMCPGGVGLWQLAPRVVLIDAACGAWKMTPNYGPEADEVWKIVRRETAENLLGFAAHVSVGSDSPTISVWIANASDKPEICRIEERLRALQVGLRIRVPMKFLDGAPSQDRFHIPACGSSSEATSYGSGPRPCHNFFRFGRCRYGAVCRYSHQDTAGHHTRGVPIAKDIATRADGPCTAEAGTAVGKGARTAAPALGSESALERENFFAAPAAHNAAFLFAASPSRGDRDRDSHAPAAPASLGLRDARELSSTGKEATVYDATDSAAAAPALTSAAGSTSAISTAGDNIISLRRIAHGVPQMNFSDLISGTHNFSAETLLGRGGTASVHRAELKNGVDVRCLAAIGNGTLPPLQVAVKVFNTATSDGLMDSLAAEIATLMRYKHNNLVRLLGYSVEPDGLRRLALVFELCERGSLLDNLGVISPTQGIDIALGVAQAISFLHHGAILPAARGAAKIFDVEPMFHRDIKSANVGLMADFQPKLLDCGLAAAAAGPGSGRYGHTLNLTASRMSGTPGYMPPELVDGAYGVRSEIYSFGVVLLEILSGRRVEMTTVRDARSKVKKGSRADLYPSIAPAWNAAAPARDLMLNLVLASVSVEPEDRPSNLEAVIDGLRAIRSALDPPEPLFPCVVCGDDFPQRGGLLCKGGPGAIDGRPQPARHFVCKECLQGVTLMAIEPDALKRSRGGVVCPGVGEIRPGAADRCAADHWTVADLAQMLQPDTLAAFAAGTVEALGTLAQVGERQAAQLLDLAAEAEKIARNRELAEAARITARGDRLNKTRNLIVERHLNLRCPRCDTVFAEYDGCDALTCGKRGCGCAFCALCLKDCGADAHAHVAAADHHRDGSGYFGGHDKFAKFHVARRTDAILAALKEQQLREPPDFVSDLVNSMEIDLRGVQVDVVMLRRTLGLPGRRDAAAVPAPRGAPMVAPANFLFHPREDAAAPAHRALAHAGAGFGGADGLGHRGGLPAAHLGRGALGARGAHAAPLAHPGLFAFGVRGGPLAQDQFRARLQALGAGGAHVAPLAHLEPGQFHAQLQGALAELLGRELDGEEIEYDEEQLQLQILHLQH